ncbi:hypothetical protein ACTRW9_03780 [Nitrospina sp. 32_T5]|uniref:hypothetical protein n=1 Tax=unclassified Nitrospina TaxID=2638683 RepID=UPI003F9BC79B
MLKKFLVLTGMVFFLISLAAGAQAENANEDFTPKHFLIHVKTSLDEDDAQICVAPNVALAALRKGHRVTLLFDGSAVTSVKKGGWFGSDQTPMDKAALPERERVTLAEQFGMNLNRIPHDYGEYLAFLKSEGADLKINRTMMLLYKIEPEDIDSNLRPILLSEMIEIIQKADHYLVY